MSSSDRMGTYQTPCPKCGGEVAWWYFGPDDGYSPGSRGIQCTGKCNKEFTNEEWEKIEPPTKLPKVKPDYCCRSCHRRPSRCTYVTKPTSAQVEEIEREIVSELRKMSPHLSCLLTRIEKIGETKHPKKVWSDEAVTEVFRNLLASGKVVESPGYRFALKK